MELSILSFIMSRSFDRNQITCLFKSPTHTCYHRNVISQCCFFHFIELIEITQGNYISGDFMLVLNKETTAVPNTNGNFLLNLCSVQMLYLNALRFH